MQLRLGVFLHRQDRSTRNRLSGRSKISQHNIVQLEKVLVIQTHWKNLCYYPYLYVISPLPLSLARSLSRRPFPLFGSWTSSLLPFFPLPSYSPARPLALELSTSRRRCAVDHLRTPTSSRHHDASLTSVNADLPTFIISCCYILTLVPPTSSLYDPSTALFDWPARQILRSHLLFLFPLQPRTNGLLTVVFLIWFFSLSARCTDKFFISLFISLRVHPPCLFDTLTVPATFFFG